MILFLDTSTLLSAAGSANGAARFVILEAKATGWELVSSDYCAEETRRNLPKGQIQAWIARDEADMKAFRAAEKGKKR